MGKLCFYIKNFFIKKEENYLNQGRGKEIEDDSL